MSTNKASASTKFYMDQSNKLVDVLSEIIPPIYCDIFKDDFDVFMYGLWESADEKYPPIMDQSILRVGESIQTLEKIDWKSLPKEKRLEWLKRMDLQALLKAVRYREKTLKLFCEKNSLIEDKITMVYQSLINWRNYGVGHKSIYKYEQMNEAVFKLKIIEPVWEFYDFLSRYYEKECRELHTALMEIEKKTKQPLISIEELALESKEDEKIIKAILFKINVYVDADNKIKGENISYLLSNIKSQKKYLKKEELEKIGGEDASDLLKRRWLSRFSEAVINHKKIVVTIFVALICVVTGVLIWKNQPTAIDISEYVKIYYDEDKQTDYLNIDGKRLMKDIKKSSNPQFAKKIDFVLEEKRLMKSVNKINSGKYRSENKEKVDDLERALDNLNWRSRSYEQPELFNRTLLLNLSFEYEVENYPDDETLVSHGQNEIINKLTLNYDKNVMDELGIRIKNSVIVKTMKYNGEAIYHEEEYYEKNTEK